MKNILLLLILASIQLSGNCQVYSWASFCGHTTNSSSGAEAMAYDSDGFLYTAARFQNNVSCQLTTIDAMYAESDDVYVTKWNTSGTMIWQKVFGGTWYDSANAIAIDDSHAVYVAASVQYPEISFSDGVSANNTTGSMLVKYSPSGSILWIKFYSDQIRVMQYHDNMLYTASGAIINKLDTSGVITSQLIASQTGYATINAMEISNNHKIAIAGTFISTAQFGNEVLNNSINGAEETFYMQLTTDLEVEWLKGIRAYSYSYAERIALDYDHSDNIYTVLSSTVDIPFDADTLHSNGINTIGVVKIDSAGNVVWIEEIHDSDGIASHSLVVLDDQVFVGGEYAGSALLPDGSNLPADGYGDNLVAIFTTDGGFVSADGSGSPAGTDRVICMATDGIETIFIGGLDFSGNPTFGCDTYETPAGQYIAAVQTGDYHVQQPIISENGTLLTVEPEFNESIQWFLNGVEIEGATGQSFTALENGSYTVTYLNQYNCSATSEMFIESNISVDDINEHISIEIFPNPASEILNIRTSKRIEEFSIIDMQGQNILTNTNSVNSVDLRMVPAGIYYAKIVIKDQVLCRAFIKG